jgi:cation diffusion facilitator family transporter
MQSIRTSEPKQKDNRLYRSAMVITLLGNLLLAITKAIAAWITGSAALYADAANSISDVVYSLMLVMGLWLAQRPPDQSHPQGHSRFEPLVSLVITLSMVFAGFEAARNAWVRFQAGGEAVEMGFPALILLFAAGLKIFMYIRVKKIGETIHSPALKTTALDNLSDVLTSIAAFLGVAGSGWIHPLLDPVAGFVVAAWIFRAAFMAARENLGFLTGAGVDEDLHNKMIAELGTVPGILKVHYLNAEYAGPRILVELHANVDGNLTLTEAHDIESAAISRLLSMNEIDRVYIHLEPLDEDVPSRMENEG